MARKKKEESNGWSKYEKYVLEQINSIVNRLGSLTVVLEDLKANMQCAVHGERFKRYDEHIETSRGWRLSVTGIVVALLIQIGTFIYYYGIFSEKVSDNVEHIKSVEKEIKDLTHSLILEDDIRLRDMRRETERR